MLLTIQPDQIQQIIPDANSEKAAKKLAKVNDWNNKGASTDQWVWAEIKGSAIYQSAIFLPQLKCECSCPSFKRPCKHALALLMVYQEHPAEFQIQEDETQFPERVTKWRDKLTQSTEKKAEKANKPVDEAARAKRQESRDKKIDQAIDALQLWLKDVVNLGLGEVRSQNGRQFFHEITSRLVDGQAAGINIWIDEFSSALYQPNWQQHSAFWLARLYLIAELWQKRAQLSLDLQQELRQLMGINLASDFWSSQSTEELQLSVLASRTQALQQSKGNFRRQWLWDEKTCTDYLILDFDIAPHTRYGLTLPSQHHFKLKAQRYPGVEQQRLKLAEQVTLNDIDAIKIENKPPQGFVCFEDALAKHAEKLSHNPMHLTSFWWMNPVRLSQKDERYYLIDSTHHMMPIALSTDQFISLWMMVSNQPFYAGLEWNGLELQLISLWQGAHYQCL
ncbi:SWIM zinc finger family protein [Acinetobacter sp. Marseille-Q1623]|uniref:SWIM zinc finger family protein n=1 Tax=Acinetobacter sp. Marseille-Q1623 TaxID=2697501 RepID=UPI00157B1832|nr:SWIM zinc finger family protein [Acinetobacter sp. Marseille-Q1623]